jgi:hypothetical protein
MRVELTTLLGIDEHPAEFPPWGFTPATTAREMIKAMFGAQWRFVVCDSVGRPICSGITTARAGLPNAPPATYNPRRGGMVEIQVKASDLCWLDAACAEIGAYPQWAAVVFDITAKAGAGEVDLDAADKQVRRRLPTSALKRLVQVWARWCTHPACSVPAIEGDLDHAVEYARGGTTTAGNLHPPCRHDHRLRHEGGWGVEVSENGQARWTSALGHIYPTTPPPVLAELSTTMGNTANAQHSRAGPRRPSARSETGIQLRIPH